MKKRFMKSAIAIILVMIAVFLFNAAMQPRWKYVSSISGDISISTFGNCNRIWYRQCSITQSN